MTLREPDSRSVSGFSSMPWPFEPLTPFSFDLAMIDFPWSFRTWSQNGKKHKSPEGHYQTLSIEAIRAFPIGHLLSKNGIAWIWATHPMLPEQIDCLRFWGLKYVTSGVWVKRTKTGKLAFGTGYRLRSASEPFIIATNGNPTTAPVVRTVIEGPLREHSRKPDEAYVEAERLMPGARRADLFSRYSRPGWTAWGDEAGKFNLIAGGAVEKAKGGRRGEAWQTSGIEEQAEGRAGSKASRIKGPGRSGGGPQQRGALGEGEAGLFAEEPLPHRGADQA